MIRRSRFYRTDCRKKPLLDAVNIVHVSFRNASFIGKSLPPRAAFLPPVIHTDTGRSDRA
ncbi:hypothetical protein QCA50_011276 [Cerrena zonata]|uniref:Ycf15 n=1 Tax=Cerrena zonata TaxID=2478898 RepID=A0AAW0G5Y6_9APHY